MIAKVRNFSVQQMADRWHMLFWPFREKFKIVKKILKIYPRSLIATPAY